MIFNIKSCYSKSFKCLEVERYIIRLQGGILDPEEEANNLKMLAKLEDTHAKVQRSLAGTELQNKKLDDNMRQLVDFMNADSKRIFEMVIYTKHCSLPVI